MRPLWPGGGACEPMRRGQVPLRLSSWGKKIPSGGEKPTTGGAGAARYRRLVLLRQREALTATSAFVRHHGSIVGDRRFLLEAGPSRSSTWLD